jgi:RNA polymerase sigma-70 factor (ECF subfamily)
MTVTSKDINIGTLSTDYDFETIFLEQWSQIFSVIFRLVGDRDEAEDLALETFWKLYREPPSKGKNLNGWLYRVAVNLGLNALRARKRRSHYEGQAGAQLLDDYPSLQPENEIERAENRQVVRNVLVRMKPRSAKLLVLRQSGFSYKELAAVVNVKPTSVGTLLARAEGEFELIYHQLRGG